MSAPNVILFPDDDDEWIELERPSSGKVLPDVALRLGKQPRTGRVAAYVSLRGQAAQHIQAYGPRYRILIGGREADRIKLIPDARAGQYELSTIRGVARLFLGVVTAWPAEIREPVACAWRRDGASTAMLLQLPSGFTRPAKPEPALLPPPVPAQLAPAASPPLLAKVVAERDELAERLRQVEEERNATIGKVPEQIGQSRLPRIERQVVALLLERQIASKEAIMHATADDVHDDTRDAKLVDVLICRLRPKLAEVGVEIKTHHGEGYSISLAQRRSLKQLFGMSGARA